MSHCFIHALIYGLKVFVKQPMSNKSGWIKGKVKQN